MDNRYIKRFSASLIMRETELKTTRRYHLTPLKWLLSKRQEISVGEDVEKREPLYTVGGNVNWCRNYGKKVWRLLKKLKIGLLYDPAILLLGIYLKEI